MPARRGGPLLPHAHGGADAREPREQQGRIQPMVWTVLCLAAYVVFIVVAFAVYANTAKLGGGHLTDEDVDRQARMAAYYLDMLP